MKRLIQVLALLALGAGAILANQAQPLDENIPLRPPVREEIRVPLRAVGDPVDLDQALQSLGSYLQQMAADVTEDNAGNGTDGVDESPDDPDDGGWDWVRNSPADPFFHSTSASPKNIYGATGIGLLYAYMESGDAGLFTALTDAADVMIADADIRSAGDLIFLMLYDDLPAVSGTTYADSARAKYEGRMAIYGSADSLAKHIRDVRAGQGYENGIIAWDVGAWARAAAMLDDRYSGNGYDTDADDIAEVLWEDSFNDNPGYFDIVDDAGWDPTYSNLDYYWYNLGITGLIDAFSSAGVHTSEIAGLVTRLLDGQYTGGAISFSYGANDDDADWQSTAYAMMTLGNLDQATYQTEINHMGYWAGATQDASGGWLYGSGNHYPEECGELGGGLSFTTNAVTTVLVDDDFTSQADVDAYNTANATNYVWGYDAFGTIQGGVDGVLAGGSVDIAEGTYVEQVHVTKSNLSLAGAGTGLTVIESPVTLTEFFTSSDDNYPVVFIDGATGVALADLTVDGANQGDTNYRFVGVGFWNGDGSMTDMEVLNVMDSAFSGAQHGVGVYSYNDTGGPYTITMTDVLVDDYQKTGVALLGDGLTVDLTRVTTVGQGATGVTAQNGIQVGYGSGGTIADCDISGNSYTGETYTASGFLPSDGAPITVTGMALDGNQTSVYWISMSGSFSEGTVTNPEGDGFYAYNASAKKSDFDRPLPSPIDEGLGGGAKASMAVTVDNCDFFGTDLEYSWGMGAFSTSPDAVDITVTGCRFLDWDTGFYAYDYGGPISAELHGNSFTSSTYAVVASSTLADIVDASWNFYGVVAPAAVAALIDGPVDYTPWAVGGTVFTKGFEIDLSELWVDDDSPQTGAGGRIQEGIDLVDGSTVNVAAGTYEERLSVHKAVDLRGAQYGVDPTTLGARTDSGAESIVDITGLPVTNPNVAVEVLGGVDGASIAGFTLIGSPTSHYADETVVRAWGNDLTVADNIIDGYFALLHKGGSGIDVLRNRMTINKVGVTFQPGTYDGCVIAGNHLIPGTGPASDASGIYMTGCTAIEVSGNVANGFPGGNGVGGSNLTNVQVLGNEFASCRKGVNFWGATTFITIAGNQLTGCSSAGVNVKGQDIDIENNIIEDNDIGVDVGYHVIDTKRVTLSYNSIVGNTTFGVREDGASDTVDARFNWWGDSSGPNVAKRGSGDNVTGNVAVDPWIGKEGGENIVCDPDPEVLTVASPTKTIDVNYLGGGSGLVYGYNMTFSWDPSVSTSVGQVTQGNLLSDQGTTQFFANQVGSTITVNCVLLGAQPGVSGPGTMFSVEFDGVSCDTSVIDLTVVAVRDNNNQPLSGFYADDGAIYVDLTAPVFTVNGPAVGECYAAAPVLDLEASEACGDLDDAFYRVDGGAWTADAGLFTDYAGVAWTNATWTLPGFAGLGEGEHTVDFYCTDDFGDSSATVSWTFTKDTVAPPVATAFDAAPGNGKVHLSWTNPVSDDFDHVVVVRKAWDASSPYGYPDYLGSPSYPADPSDGVTVYSGTASSFDDDPLTDRSIWFYRAFTYDCADNYSGGTPPGDPILGSFAQGDRATNYWLGDVASPYDGEVKFADINDLSDTYWEVDGSLDWNGECDVGPTDNWSRLGIPRPDDVVDFEDLLIFAMNFNVVDPSGKASPPVVLAGASKASSPTLRLLPADEGTADLPVRLVLEGNDGEVKGASVELLFDASVLEFVSAVPSQDLSSGQVFFISEERSSGRVTIDLAALGTERSIHGSGDLAVLSFTRRAEGDGDLRFGDVILRDAENGNVDFQTDNATGVLPGTIPSVTRLVGAAPNPFNPTTTIRFEMNVPSHVSVVIYDAQGRMVRTLVDESKSAGAFDAVWDGRDDRGHSAGSGVYFVRMVAGDYSRSAKVVMLR
ncbi:MAG: right-handed parallel beta-helix repeat-containing protein [Candidatus Eisenbacteria bacterium]